MVLQAVKKIGFSKKYLILYFQKKGMLKVIAIYARQSVDKKDSLSIETQIDFCTNYINSTPHKETIEIYQDKGYSGKNIHRPDFTRMMADIECGKISKIVVYKLDRISRNLLDFMSMWQKFNEFKVEFCAVDETFDTSSAMGRGMLKISMVFAEMERETIQSRVKDNYYHRIQDGRWPGGPAPYGFKNGRTKNNIPTLIKVSEEITAIKLAFNHYEDDFSMSLGKVARLLEKKGYQSRKRNSFDNVTIGRILQNPVYAIADETLYKFFKTRKAKILNPIEEWDGTRSAVIVGKRVANNNTRKYTDLSEQTVCLTNFKGFIKSRQYVKVQERLAQNQQIKRANAPTRLKELAGLLKCAKCEYAIKIYNDPKLDCYNNRGLHSCDAQFKTVNFEALRKSIRMKVLDVIKHLAERVEESERGYKKIEEELNELVKKRDNLVFLSSGKTKLEKAFADTIEKLQDQIEEKELQLSTYTPIRYEAFDFDLIEIELADIEKAKEIYRKLIKRVLLEENGDYTIEWKI